MAASLVALERFDLLAAVHQRHHDVANNQVRRVTAVDDMMKKEAAF